MKPPLEAVELNEETWRAWVQRGKVRDARAGKRATWILGAATILGIAAIAFALFGQ